MKLNIDQPIKDFSDKSIQVGDKDKTSLTFRTVIETTLNSHSEQYPLTAEKKLQAFQIGLKLFGKKLPEYTLTIDQVAFIKERIGLFYGPVIYGRFP